MRKLLGGPAIMLTGVLLILGGWAYGETTLRDTRVAPIGVRYRAIRWIPVASHVLPPSQTDVGVLLWAKGLPVVMGVRSERWNDAGDSLDWVWVVDGKSYRSDTFTHWAKPVPPE